MKWVTNAAATGVWVGRAGLADITVWHRREAFDVRQRLVQAKQLLMRER
jgi:hypothetical protein